MEGALMASRTLWKGSISFGLVSIPVGLYTVDNSAGLDLDMLDKRNNARIPGEYKHCACAVQ